MVFLQILALVLLAAAVVVGVWNSVTLATVDRPVDGGQDEVVTVAKATLTRIYIRGALVTSWAGVALVIFLMSLLGAA